MPIYSYLCRACQSKMEVLAKMSDAPPQTCTHCGKQGQLDKLLARTAFQLKGDGWYHSNYEGKSNRSSSPTQTESTPASTTTNET
jgi:putative FmdB family regulatory protein